jgi:hypothetical protein
MGDNLIDEKLSEEMIDATLADSFPASDPPSWTLGREKQKDSSRTENSPKTGFTVETKDQTS